MIQYQFFPRSRALTHELEEVVQCFVQHEDEICSDKNNLKSNEVLNVLTPALAKLRFQVETSKAQSDKINVPVLFGQNNCIDKCFNADALSQDGKIVLEVEAGRAVRNNQFLKDVFQACMMHEVEYLVIALRNTYHGTGDFNEVRVFLETLYISNRLHLPLKGILLIGY